MRLEEKQLSTKRIFEGSVINVRVDEVELENGARAKREIVEHGGAVCVLPLTDQNEAIMVRQYRYAFGEAMLEVPAGKLDNADEPIEKAVRRELEEETGMTTSELIYLGEFRPSVAIFTEVIHMFLAKGLVQGEQHPDDDEFLQVEKYSFEALLKMVMDGEIKDGKTIAVVLKTKMLLK